MSSFEVIVVNDGSSDGSWNVLTHLKTQHPWLRAIDLAHNGGQSYATLCGIEQARGERIITMDDDLQHPPEAIPLLVKALANNVELIYALPSNAYKGRVYAACSAAAKRLLCHLLGTRHFRTFCSFRLFRARLIDKAQLQQAFSQEWALDGLLAASARNIDVIRVEYAPRYSGESHYTFLQSACMVWRIARGYGATGHRFMTLSAVAWLGGLAAAADAPALASGLLGAALALFAAALPLIQPSYEQISSRIPILRSL